ncbi:MAG: 4Fe-4S dicluster domain-containing protein [Phycisphaerae bacterium]|nr:4Fe-4S dicluster domain-containing protein [Phycisphaerae bacterium]
MSETQAQKLGMELLEHIRGIPGGRSIDKCIQCGTCTGSCPTSNLMYFSPRQVLAALRAGMLDQVLKSNTPWFCTSCYSCAVRCPAKIPFTDVMYELKRMAVKQGSYPRRDPASAMVRSFSEVVRRYGRNAEAILVGKYYLRTNPLKILGQVPMVIKLLAKRRMAFFPHKIKGIDGLKKMLAAVGGNHEGKP